jgi:hypothetical protein
MYAEVHRNARRSSDLTDAEQSIEGVANGGESGEA